MADEKKTPGTLDAERPARTRAAAAAKKPAAKTAAAEAKPTRARAAAAKPVAKADAEAKPTLAKAAASKPAAKATDAKPTRARAASAKPAAKDAAEAKPTRARAAASKPAAKAPATEAAAEVAEVAKPARTRAAAKAPTGKEPAKRAAAAPVRAPARKPRPVGPVTVRAHARYVHSSARKARLVCNHIRGKSVPEARALLGFAPRGVAADWAKLLDSAIANAEHNHELVGDQLHVTGVYADEGPTLKRFRPRAMGRATPIHKRTSHLTIMLGPKE